MTETAEMVRLEEVNALDLFTPGGIENMLAQIEQEVDRYIPDTSTTQGRRDIASLARKVASSKVAIDKLGMDLVAEWKNKAKKVDAERRRWRDGMDVLRDRARQPLTEWEAEQAAIAEQKRLEEEKAQAEEEAYAEYELRESQRIAAERQAEIDRKEAELARREAELRAREEKERQAREQAEREERIAREAQERAMKEAETAVERARLEAERQRQQAEAKAQAEKEAAVREAERKVREEADRREKERLAAEEAERKEQQRLAADTEHRDEIELDAIASLVNEGMASNVSKRLIKLISEGKVKHVTINY